MLFKFFLFKNREFFKKNYGIYFLFFILEISIVLMSFILKTTQDFPAMFLGYITNKNNILLITINKLFLISFLTFIITKSSEFIQQFSNSCFIGRVPNKKIKKFICFFNFIHLLILFFLLLIISFCMCNLTNEIFHINIINALNFFLLQLFISNFYCLINNKKNFSLLIIFLIIISAIFILKLYNNFIILIILNLLIYNIFILKFQI